MRKPGHLHAFPGTWSWPLGADRACQINRAEGVQAFKHVNPMFRPSGSRDHDINMNDFGIVFTIRERCSQLCDPNAHLMGVAPLHRQTRDGRTFKSAH